MEQPLGVSLGLRLCDREGDVVAELDTHADVLGERVPVSVPDTELDVLCERLELTVSLGDPEVLRDEERAPVEELHRDAETETVEHDDTDKVAERLVVVVSDNELVEH